MSRHHRDQRWTAKSPKLREKLARTLPAPCIECGNPVMPSDSWHVGHKRAAMDGGAPTTSNVGVAHARCNTSSGGRMGATITNGARRRRTDEGQGIRRWVG